MTIFNSFHIFFRGVGTTNQWEIGSREMGLLSESFVPPSKQRQLGEGVDNGDPQFSRRYPLVNVYSDLYWKMVIYSGKW